MCSHGAVVNLSQPSVMLYSVCSHGAIVNLLQPSVVLYSVCSHGAIVNLPQPSVVLIQCVCVSVFLMSESCNHGVLIIAFLCRVPRHL